MLEVTAHVRYGAVRRWTASPSSVAGGHDHRRPRRERRRQDDAAAHASPGWSARSAGAITLRRHATSRRRRVEDDRPARRRARARGRAASSRELTVEENLRLGGLWRARRAGAAPATRAEVYELFPPLAERADAAGRHPVRRRAPDARDRPRADGRARGCCCSTSRRSGWRRGSSRRSWRSLRELRDEHGLTVLLVEQNARSALSVADEAVVLNARAGRRRRGRPTQLAADEDLRHAYLGF